MTREEFDTLCRDDMRRAVEENLGRDPLAVALDRRTPHAALVATQVKYLERARTKLPSYYTARCILPPRAFEQASSEACAAHKEPAGDAALDLTCGLGVDALALGRRFRRVVALERDPVLAAVAARNLRLLGAANVEVVCASAEEYLAATTERFDWVAADPRPPQPDRAQTRPARRVFARHPAAAARRPAHRRTPLPEKLAAVRRRRSAAALPDGPHRGRIGARRMQGAARLRRRHGAAAAGPRRSAGEA